MDNTQYLSNPENIPVLLTLLSYLKTLSGSMRDLLEKRKPSNTISSYVLGFYLPWLFVGRSIPDLEIIEHPEVKWDIDTTELNVLEAADELKIGIDKEYVYNIRSKPLVEKYSMEKKLLDHGLPE